MVSLSLLSKVNAQLRANVYQSYAPRDQYRMTPAIVGAP